MSPDTVDAEQATLRAFAEPTVRDEATDVGRDQEQPDWDAGGTKQCVDMDRLKSIDERLCELEQVVPGIDGLASEWVQLARLEKEATILARLVRLTIHVEDALSDDEPAVANRGFQ